ncbi:MAG: glycosyltransferase family 2 protein [Halobacteriota archaeon]
MQDLGVEWSELHHRKTISFLTRGGLISKSALDRIRYYDPRNFFIGSDDADYAFRSTAQHMAIRLVVGAEARHPGADRRSTEKRRGRIDAGVIDSIRPNMMQLLPTICALVCSCGFSS